MKYLICSLLVISIIALSCKEEVEKSIDLSGEWQFQIDPEDRGLEREWFKTDLPETVKLPGSMVENGKGNDITLDTRWGVLERIQKPYWYKDPKYAPFVDPDNVLFPFGLQPEKEYTGAAWYQKKFTAPSNWQGKTVRLTLERVHWESKVWVNGEPAGMQNSLATPHIYDVSSLIEAGENTVSIRVDNRIKDIDVGINAHSITNHIPSNWNGIVGEISLNATGKITFENVRIFPDIANKTAEIRATVNNSLAEEKAVNFSASARLKNNNKATGEKSWEFQISPGENQIKMNYALGENALLWCEFNPNVYELRLTLKSETEKDDYTVDFGLREMSANENSLYINGRPLFLRGTVESAIFPSTGYPPTDVESWERIIRVCKDHGLNHFRFHSWCPPRAAFIAADKLGFYFQVEASVWTTVGDGDPVDEWLYLETNAIVDAYGNHPSFSVMSHGNEPYGADHASFLKKYVEYWKEKDSRRLYTAGAGRPLIPENDFHLPVHRRTRIQEPGQQLNSIINSQPPRSDYDWRSSIKDWNMPVVSHETGQWCVYPNFREMEKYDGVLKPNNYKIFKKSLEANHMLHLADSFLMASGKLQALCYKADIEAALRTPGFAGFQLLALYDYPGQGTAVVGVLDAFWEEKGYISPEEFRRFCNTTVPLARLEKHIFIEGETLTADIEVAHFGERPLKAVNPVWKITSGNTIVAEGALGQHEIPIGIGTSLGKIVHQFQKENNPRKLTLEVGIGEFENSWEIWVYPENQTTESDVVKIVEKLDQATLNFLEDGGKVLLSLGKGKVTPEMGGDIGVGFSSIFWNTTWTAGGKPHTLGILCNPEHPALELFPTEYHSNWQWWDAMSHSDAIILDSFPVGLKPIVQIIDDWVSNRRLALLFEAKVGDGRILVSGVDLVNNMQNRAEARQLKSSLLNYMEGDHFSPYIQLNGSDLTEIIK